MIADKIDPIWWPQTTNANSCSGFLCGSWTACISTTTSASCL